MSLTLNVKHLEKHSVEFEGLLSPEEIQLDIQDDLVQFSSALQYRFVAERHENGILLQGTLSWTWECDCARCLKHFQDRQNLAPWVLMLPFDGDEAVNIVNDCVDLTPYMREDMVLELPQRPLCRPDCRGLSEQTESRTDAGTDTPKKSDPQGPWQELDKLNFS